WFTSNLRWSSSFQIPGLKESVVGVRKVFREDDELLPRDRIILGGSGQGVAVALAALLADGQDGFASLCSFSGYFPLHHEAKVVIHQEREPGIGFCSPAKKATIIERMFGGLQWPCVAWVPRGTTYRVGTMLPAQVGKMTKLWLELQHLRDDQTVPGKYGDHIKDGMGRLGWKLIGGSVSAGTLG
ncbi:hypothetical protein QBC36DRAFT_367883, partial [Triangularia setosa]